MGQGALRPLVPDTARIRALRGDTPLRRLASAVGLTGADWEAVEEGRDVSMSRTAASLLPAVADALGVRLSEIVVDPPPELLAAEAGEHVPVGVRELADLFGVTPPAVHRWAERPGRLPPPVEDRLVWGVRPGREPGPVHDRRWDLAEVLRHRARYRPACGRPRVR